MKFSIYLVLGLLMVSAAHAATIRLYTKGVEWEDQWCVAISERESIYNSKGLADELTIFSPVYGAVTLKFDQGVTITQLRTKPTCAILLPKGNKLHDELYLIYPGEKWVYIVNILDVYNLLEGQTESRPARFTLELKDKKIIIKRSLGDASTAAESEKKEFVFTEQELVSKCKGSGRHVKRITPPHHLYLDDVMK